jgi:hypothetical protein
MRAFGGTRNEIRRTGPRGYHGALYHRGLWRDVSDAYSPAVPEHETPEPDVYRLQHPRRWADSSASERRFELPQELGELKYEYRAFRDSEPLQAIWKWVRDATVTAAILEREYIDADYRDEYAHFYAHVFESLPNRCERLHFIRDESYLGYVSLRPIRKRPVSRTLLMPPVTLSDAVACLAPASAQYHEIRVGFETFPFMSQDARYGVCAHACIWMVAHYHHLRHQTRRVFLSDVVEAAKLRSETHRVNPSGGLSAEQMSTAFRELGLPAIVYQLEELAASAEEHVRANERAKVNGPLQLPDEQEHSGPNDKRLQPPPAEALTMKQQAEVNRVTGDQVERIVCRYLNSHLPVVVVTRNHATVLIGYGRKKGSERLFFVRHDDSDGPYDEVAGWDRDWRGAWGLIMVPLPGRIYLAGEDAEAVSRQQLHYLIQANHELENLGTRKMRFRTYAIRGVDYKRRMAERALPADVRALQSRISTSNWIWVTELQDRDAAYAGRLCVVAEIAVDATSDLEDPNFLFANFPTATYVWRRESEEPIYFSNSRDSTSLVGTGTALHVEDEPVPGEATSG